jgi:hypothetical protein
LLTRLLLVAALAAIAGTLPGAEGAPRRPVQKALRAAIEDVPHATAHRYGAKDDRGTSLDTLKVVPDGHGGYFGVYHGRELGVFVVKLAHSTDLLEWTHVIDLDVHASQPTLKRTAGGGFVLADEKDSGCSGTGPGGNCLGIRHYPSGAALRAGTPDRTYQAPRSLSRCAEGTPDISSARIAPDTSRAIVRVSFHYFRDCDVDRQAAGVLRDFRTWSAKVDQRTNRRLEAFRPGGNIGDRDIERVRGRSFSLQEVQFRKGDFGSWRVFLMDRKTGKTWQLRIKTHVGSTAFANPTFTVLRSPRGRPALLVTLFLPSEGAAVTEGGELIYYRELGWLRRARAGARV